MRAFACKPFGITRGATLPGSLALLLLLRR
jgi:hypothetical protein